MTTKFGSRLTIEGELLPWVNDGDRECIQVKVEGKVEVKALEAVLVVQQNDNFQPFRKGVARVRPSRESHNEWQKTVRKWKGKQVKVIVNARRFDGFCCDYGPEHGWALDLISMQLKKTPYSAKRHH
jgi:hypothetical protein